MQIALPLFERHCHGAIGTRREGIADDKVDGTVGRFGERKELVDTGLGARIARYTNDTSSSG